MVVIQCGQWGWDWRLDIPEVNWDTPSSRCLRLDIYWGCPSWEQHIGFCGITIIVMVQLAVRCECSISSSAVQCQGWPVQPMIPLLPDLIVWHCPMAKGHPEFSGAPAGADEIAEPPPMRPGSGASPGLMTVTPVGIPVDGTGPTIINSCIYVGSSCSGYVGYCDHSQIQPTVIDLADLVGFEGWLC